MPKNIVFCADGTDNGPGVNYALPAGVPPQLLPDETNVFKLFVQLNRAPLPDGNAMEQETQEVENGAIIQWSKYLDGVGTGDGPIVDLFGSALGVGLAARIVRGYTFLSRAYDPGDNIYLVGFSRGAYTVRALAGMILQYGLLDKTVYNLNAIPYGSLGYPSNPTAAYTLGAAVWAAYAKATAPTGGWLAEVVHLLDDFPAFFSAPPPASYVQVPNIRAVGVWDTVGSYLFDALAADDGSKTQLFPFANTQLSPRVLNGYQALSLDELRNVFTPILWDQATNVSQTIFAGGHADVGGGYSMATAEAQLSDIPLAWLMGKLISEGLRVFPTQSFHTAPNPVGIAHQQWRYSPWTTPFFTLSPRRYLDRPDVLVDPSISTRMAAPSVVSDPGTGDPKAPPLPPVTGPYRPQNMP
jgi:uncharacterized protein (DUF2235 family)